MEAGFKYGLSSGSLSSTKVGTYSNGSISVSLTGLTEGATYYYQAYATVKGEGEYASSQTTFYGGVQSVRLTGIRTWLTSYEIPANNASSVTESDVYYNGFYSHSTVNETYGNTKAAIYNTSSTDQKIVVHTFEYNSKVNSNYTMLYDKTRKCALWIAYKHNPTEYRDCNVGRNEGWTYDPALPQDWQPNLSGTYTSSGITYDRGHQVASNDRQTTTAQNKQTFYYSNMTPQFNRLNQGEWGTMENRIQGIVSNTRSGEETYVVTGPLFNGTSAYAYDRSNAACPAPTGYFKCVIKCTFNSSGEVVSANGCGYIVETNSSNTAPTKVTIDYVENKTGFDLFASLPDSIEAAAESVAYNF